MIDNTGHGTDAVKLVYKTCNTASVYVARVWEREDSENSQQVMGLMETVGTGHYAWSLSWKRRNEMLTLGYR